ncbi:hypothetical protein BJY54_000313 [Streptomyces nodosus]|nr:hypothetical protein [Streptomyces nodosus]
MTSASVNIANSSRLRTADGQYGLVQLGPECLPQHCRLSHESLADGPVRMRAATPHR